MAPEARANAPFGEGIYSPSISTRTYETLLDRAKVALELGETVILDASWTDDAWRARARGLAYDARADLTELRCDAPVEVAAGRIRKRMARSTSDGSYVRDPSDATPEIAAALAEKEAPWPSSTRIDTSGSPDAALVVALEHFERCDLHL